MANLQVKSIDNHLYESFARRAVMENRSISQEVISILKAYLSSPSRNNNTNEQFLELCGTWQDNKSAEPVVEDIASSRNQLFNHRDVNFLGYFA